jgi:hypothetical protein
MPVDYQKQPLFQGRSPSGGTRGQSSWRFWAKESPCRRYRSLVKFHSKHPPQDQFHVPAGTEGIARWIPAVSASQKYAPESTR